MVGVITSSRCDHCRKRKKKCDEKRPACTRCIQAGLICSGFITRWKFVDEAARVAGQYVGRQFVFDTVDEGLESIFEKYEDEKFQTDGTLVVHENAFFTTLSKRHFSRARSWIPRYLEFNKLASEFVFCLEANNTGVLMPLRLIGAFLEYVPGRLGQNMALDDAIACICAIYHPDDSMPLTDSKKVRQSYTKAIRSVRTHLAHPIMSKDAHVLCASILLQFFELAVNEGRGNWLQLARGNSNLIHSRGIEGYNTTFELLMFHSQLTYVLAQSMSANQFCFLTKPDWWALIRKCPDWPESVCSRSYTLRSELCIHMANMFGIMVAYRSMNDDGNPSNHSSALAKSAIELLSNVKKWRQQSIVPMTTKALEPHISNSRPEHQYPNILYGIIDSVISTSISCLRRILRSLCASDLKYPITFEERHEILSIVSNLGEDDEWEEIAGEAYERVKAMSVMASKPLEFGNQQFQVVAKTLDVDIEQYQIVADEHIMILAGLQ